jgi:hypothetical protein
VTWLRAECTHSFDLRISVTSCFCRFAILFFFEMVDVKEQRVCIKFCFKLGNSAAKTHQIVKQEFGDDALGQTQTPTGFAGLKMAERQLTMMNVLDYLFQY